MKLFSHPGRYGDQTAPWIQRKHFQAHNLSQVPLHGSGTAQYYQQNKDRFSTSQLYSNQQNPGFQAYSNDIDPQNTSNQVLRSQEQQLDKKWHPQDQRQENERYQKYSNPAIDEGFQRYKQEQDQQALQRFKEYQEFRRKEQGLSGNMDQLQPTQPEIHPPQYQNEEPNYQSVNLNQPDIGNNKSNKMILPPLHDQITYKQRYNLNNNLYNPKFGVSSEVFPQTTLNQLVQLNNNNYNPITNKYQNLKKHIPQSGSQEKFLPQQAQYYTDKQVYQPQSNPHQSSNDGQQNNDYYNNQQNERDPQQFYPYNQQVPKQTYENQTQGYQADNFQSQQPNEQQQFELQQQQQYEQQQSQQEYEQSLREQQQQQQQLQQQQQHQMSQSYLKPYRVNPTTLSFYGVPTRHFAAQQKV